MKNDKTIKAVFSRLEIALHKQNRVREIGEETDQKLKELKAAMDKTAAHIEEVNKEPTND